VEALPSLTVDEPTISMMFETNSSPFAGQDGKFLTSRQVRERLYRETLHNVALRGEDSEDTAKFRVSVRGELHLSVLLETMRREGYEIAVARPQVIYHEVNGERHEPYENLTVDVEDRHQGAIMEALGSRGGALQDMRSDSQGRVRLDYIIPARGLIGFQTDFRTMTSGSGLLHHVFEKYAPAKSVGMSQRANGALISNGTGKVVPYGLFNLQERGRLCVGPGEDVYEGQIVGIHARDNDLTVNPLKTKQLTNIRAAGRDENILLTPALRFTLEQALEFIEDDELVEITPLNIRLRKRHLKEQDRRKAGRASEAAA
jgi:GTP-binding protein